ncbi:MAG: mismatch-specific DNA-glycosylase [Pseudomonadota bacterium]
MSVLPKFGLLPKSHLVPDVLAENLDIVFCGTALGHKSALEKAYYAHPGNLFWKTLYKTGLTPQLIAPKDYAQVLSYRIGLTDLCKHAFGNDNVLPPDALDAVARDELEKKILKYQPRFLAFTSKTAASTFLARPTGKIPYGLQVETCGNTQVSVLPSPSGQGRTYWNNGAEWHHLAGLARN